MSVEPLRTLPDLDRLATACIAARHVPNATYRLQFHPDFTFADATSIVSYLHDLGISDAYASPLFTARAGSTHGYDVCDFGELNPALGGAEGFERFSAALRAHGMSIILDMVPNHMGIGNGNPWWMDVLENGQASRYARFFDIDWSPTKRELNGKVLLPILGDQYGVVLEQGELQLQINEGVLSLHYYDTQLPIAPDTIGQVLERALAEIVDELPADDADRQELESIITAVSYLPPRDETEPTRLAERYREKDVLKRRLAALVAANDQVRAALDATVQRLNGTPGEPESFDALDALIEAQAYRLAFWRVAAEEINYRRFFDINELAAVRVELPEVFAATHDLLFRLVSSGAVAGLRIDHPDGMWNPPAYFRQLQEQFLINCAQAQEDAHSSQELSAAAREWSEQHALRTARGESTWPLYVVAEKILSEREPLPSDWSVDGTTGYDFLNQVNSIFVDPASAPILNRIYRRFVAPDDPGSLPSFSAMVLEAKQQIMDGPLASEITSLGHQLERINEKNRRVRDFTLRGVTEALMAVIAEMGIYRTYITDPEHVSDRDIRYVADAVQLARRRHPGIPRSLFTFVRDTMVLRNLGEFREEDRQDVINVVMRLQQMTGPVMAKSMEDTAFYRYHRLVSLNEVGGHPDQFGMTVADFHRQNSERQRLWANSMLASSTHDTKRSEDVRARLNVLSELPDEWEAAVLRWSDWNAEHKHDVDGSIWPDRNTEYLLYQTLVGVWPLESGSAQVSVTQNFKERIIAYLQKATKEAKVHTSWISPNEDYDATLQGFIEAILDDHSDAPFLADLAAFAQRVARYGLINSLAQTLVKLTAPGVPDIYQGTELWDFSLVDPDNRRAVDYDLRQQYLRQLDARFAIADEQAGLATELVSTMVDGRIKLALISQTLRYRRDHPRLFAGGAYQALEATGAKHENVCAYARTEGEAVLIVVVPRLVVALSADQYPPLGATAWHDTALMVPAAWAGHRFRNLLTGATLECTSDTVPGLALAEVLADLPVALLVIHGEA